MKSISLFSLFPFASNSNCPHQTNPDKRGVREKTKRKLSLLAEHPVQFIFVLAAKVDMH